MKRILVWLSILGGAILGTAFLSACWLENSYLPRQIAGISVLGQPARFEKAPAIAWFPPVLTLGACEWEGRAFGMKAAFSARNISIAPNVLSFFRSQPQLKEIVLDKPSLRLEKNVSAVTETSAGAGQSWNIGIARIVVREGSVSYADAGCELKMEGLRFTGENILPKQEMSMQCDCGLRLSDANGVSLAGNFALKTLARYYAPNMTLRDGSATFTATGPEALKIFSPCHARFDGAINLQTLQGRVASASIDSPWCRADLEGETDSGMLAGKGRLELDMARLSLRGGNLVVESYFSVDSEQLALRGADLSWGGLQAGADADVKFASAGKLLSANGQWADGSFSVALEGADGRYDLAVQGDGICLGEVLRQIGLHGFAGGLTHLSANISFMGSGWDALKSSAKGRGRLACGRLELEPFGEISMLLPLLGHSSALVPKFLDNFQTSMSLDRGMLLFDPISGSGTGVTARGSASVNLANETLSGHMVLKALGLELPFVFGGPLRDPSFRIAPDFLRHKN